jgi:hypothetical protein
MRESKKYTPRLYCMARGKIPLRCMARLQNMQCGHFSLSMALLVSDPPTLRLPFSGVDPTDCVSKSMQGRRVCSCVYGEREREIFKDSLSSVSYNFPRVESVDCMPLPSQVQQYNIREILVKYVLCIVYLFSWQQNIYSPRVYCTLLPYLQVLQHTLLSCLEQGFLLF